MQTIHTKYIGPSNVRGSRVKATASSGRSITLHWDSSLDSDENHTAAAKALCDRLGWDGRWIGGGTKDGSVFVCADERWAVGTFTIERKAA